jgi:hypothetical protein
MSPQDVVSSKMTHHSVGATLRLERWMLSLERYLPAGAQALPRSGGNFGTSFFLPLFPPSGIPHIGGIQTAGLS